MCKTLGSFIQVPDIAYVCDNDSYYYVVAHSTPSYRKLVPLLEFQNEGRFVNLSRVDPSLLAGRYMSEIRHEITVDDQTAICITVGCARESALGLDASFGGPFITRGLHLVFISLEWERWGSTIGEIARRPVLKTQLWNFAVTFRTRLIRREGASFFVQNIHVDTDEDFQMVRPPRLARPIICRLYFSIHTSPRKRRRLLVPPWLFNCPTLSDSWSSLTRVC